METQKWREILIPYNQAVQELIIKFNSIVNEYRQIGSYSPIEQVTGRVKRISSILEKMHKKGISLENLKTEMDDIVGIRIICQFVEDIDIVVGLIRERHGKDMNIMEEKDYITNTKESGYRSYHVIIEYPVYTAMGEEKVLAEIQIRTLAMNFWAIIEHSLQYKYKHNIPKDIRSRLLSAANAAFHLDKEMSTIHSEIIEAQKLFQIKSNIVADISNNIQNLYKVEDFETINALQEEFIQLWKEGDMEKLVEFNNKLDKVAEVYDVQSLL